MHTYFAMPWFIRRAVYAFIGVIGLLLLGFGAITVDQYDGLAEQAATIVAPLLTVIFSHIAAKNVHAGSDSTVTVEDVIRAKNEAPAVEETNHENSVDAYFSRLRD